MPGAEFSPFGSFDGALWKAAVEHLADLAIVQGLQSRRTEIMNRSGMASAWDGWHVDEVTGGFGGQVFHVRHGGQWSHMPALALKLRHKRASAEREFRSMIAIHAEGLGHLCPTPILLLSRVIIVSWEEGEHPGIWVMCMYTCVLHHSSHPRQHLSFRWIDLS